MMNGESKFQLALQKFDSANAEDPNQEIVNGVAQPHEWIDAQRLHEWVLKLCPNASEELQLASRCQHIQRWKIPRQAYPKNRAGYLQWRAELKKFHAETAGELLRQAGYGAETVHRVQALNLKKNFPSDPEAQSLEDALCLTFLEFEFVGFSEHTEEDKMIGILQKTWKKMSDLARQEASELNFDENRSRLLKKALESV